MTRLALAIVVTAAAGVGILTHDHTRPTSTASAPHTSDWPLRAARSQERQSLPGRQHRRFTRPAPRVGRGGFVSTDVKRALGATDRIEGEPVTSPKPTATMQSSGAGIQSAAVSLLIVSGDLPKPDLAVFSDTGWEPKQVYAQVDRLTKLLAGVGVPLIKISGGNLRADSLDPLHKFVSIPLYTINPDGSHGMSRRQCTGEYKTKPIRRYVRSDVLRMPHPVRIPKSIYVEQWIGFSTDEIHRVDGGKDQPNYVHSAYPLLDLGMSRKDCERLLAANGWGDTVKSACIGCPFHGNRQWRNLRDNYPDEWADAVAFDKAIRHGGPRRRAMPKGTLCFLHASRVPLDQAPIDKVTRGEWKDRQITFSDMLAEDGDPDGCSPYGCRSGSPIAPAAELVSLGMPAIRKEAS